MAAFPDPYTLPERPASDDTKAWNRAFGKHEAAAAEQVAVPLQRHAPVLREIQIDGAPVLEIRPSGWRDDGRVTVYTHGGSQRAKVPLLRVGDAGHPRSPTGLRPREPTRWP